MVWAQNYLGVLSGLYGVLRPLDATEPYRLEMGSKLSTMRGKLLYRNGGSKITDALKEQLLVTNSSLLVNCALKDFGAIKMSSLKVPVVPPIFLENKKGNAKNISFSAKEARGAMARFSCSIG